MSLQKRKIRQEAMRTELEAILAKAERAVKCYAAYMTLELAAQVIYDGEPDGGSYRETDLIIYLAELTETPEEEIFATYIVPALAAKQIERVPPKAGHSTAYRFSRDAIGGLN